MSKNRIDVTEIIEPELGKPTGDEQADLTRAVWAAADEIEDCVGLVLVAVCRRGDGTLMATSEFLTSEPSTGEGHAAGPGALLLRRVISDAMDRWKARTGAGVN